MTQPQYPPPPAVIEALRGQAKANVAEGGYIENPGPMLVGEQGDTVVPVSRILRLGYRRAIADLRDTAAYLAWVAENDGDRKTPPAKLFAAYLEVRLAERWPV